MSKQDQLIRTLEAEVLRLQRLNQISEQGRGEAEDRLRDLEANENHCRKKYHLSPDISFGDLAAIRAELLKRLEKAEAALKDIAGYCDAGSCVGAEMAAGIANRYFDEREDANEQNV